MKKCDFCKINFEPSRKSQRFCSNKCRGDYYHNIHYAKNKCLECNKKTSYKKFCSHKCQKEYNRKKHNKNLFCEECGKHLNYKNNRFCSMICVHKYLKKNKLGSFYNPIQHHNASVNAGKSAQKTLKKENKCLYNKKNRILGSIKGNESISKQKKLKYKNVYFMSKDEKKVGLFIEGLGFKLIDNKTFQKRIGEYSFDFFIKNVFIEYHPMNGRYDKNLNRKSYYNKRRKILNNNGFKDYKLIHLCSLNELNRLKYLGDK